MNVARSDTPPRGHGAIDPITFEVIRHKLEAITEEQAITLKNVSGSPVVTEATDFNVGIYLADGAIVNMGPQVIFHAGTMSTVIYSIIENFSDNPGINEGDMFILNDPYRGAIHQPDVSIVMPIFHDGRRIAWTGSCAHELDTGGMTFGSWAFGATDVQQEAMLLPGVKIVEKGVLREDIWQMIMGMTRLPHVVGLDFKAMIAANNVAARRFHQLMDRYGVETVDQVMRTEIDTSETRLRERLKRIPDGIYRARDFLDHDGHANRLYQIEVAAIKRGDTLTLDMGESSPQAPGFINCTRSGLRGALFTGLLPILAPRHPLERRRAQAGHDQGAGGEYLQRALADAGVRRHGLDRVGRAECRGRRALAHGRRRARIGARGPSRHQGAILRADHGRRRSRRRSVRHAADGRDGGRRRRLYRS